MVLLGDLVGDERIRRRAMRCSDIVRNRHMRVRRGFIARAPKHARRSGAIAHARAAIGTPHQQRSSSTKTW